MPEIQKLQSFGGVEYLIYDLTARKNVAKGKIEINIKGHEQSTESEVKVTNDRDKIKFSDSDKIFIQ